MRLRISLAVVRLDLEALDALVHGERSPSEGDTPRFDSAREHCGRVEWFHTGLISLEKAGFESLCPLLRGLTRRWRLSVRDARFISAA